MKKKPPYNGKKTCFAVPHKAGFTVLEIRNAQICGPPHIFLTSEGLE
jgi:hypothetical protein